MNYSSNLHISLGRDYSGAALYEQVFDSVKRYIVSEGLRPGDKLPTEADLCKYLGVSRNSIREALKALQKLGIIEAKQKEGMVVRAFNYDPIIENMEYGLMVSNQKLIDLINLRIKLELSYLEEAIDRSTPVQIQRLRAIVEEMRLRCEKRISLLQCDMDFHLELYGQVDNDLFQQLVSLFWKLLIKIGQQKGIDFDPNPVKTVEVHNLILASFAERNYDKCYQCILDHYYVRERLQAMLREGEAPPPDGFLQAAPPDQGEILDTQGCKERVLSVLKKQSAASHSELVEAVSPCLPPSLSRAQKARKISNLLQTMRRIDGTIETVGVKSYAKWVLVTQYRTTD